MPAYQGQFSVNIGNDIHRNAQFSEGPLIDRWDNNIKTVYDANEVAWRTFSKHPALGRNLGDHFSWTSYDEMHEMVIDLASGLASLNLPRGSNIGIYSKGTPEWIITEHACHRMSLVPVPLYDTLGRDAIQHIIDQTEMRLCFCSEDKVSSLSGLVDHVFVIDKKESFQALMQKGKENRRDPAPPEPNDLFTICYTSGATGTPKGVMLTHANAIAFIACQLAQVGLNPLYPLQDHLVNEYAQFGLGDVHLSYLPLAHILERAVVMTGLVTGVSVAFHSGNILDLPKSFQTLKPTAFIAVPRLLNRIYDKVTDEISKAGWFKRWIFALANRRKQISLENGSNTAWPYDQFIFRRIKERLGGHVQKVLVGGAPMRPEVLLSMRTWLCCPVFEGYGQTETFGCTSVSWRSDQSTAGHVGAPFASVEIKLIPAMDGAYHGKTCGEICVRGPCCFVGYYKDPEKTKETLVDGWVRSGDIGKWDSRGRLCIIDRVKHLFKLAQGEYISPEQIEAKLHAACPSIAQVFLHGDPLEMCTVAIVVPAEDFSNDQVIAQLKDNKLSSLEKPRAIFIERHPFSIENDLLTPTLKVKREHVRARYRQRLAELYASLKAGHSEAEEIVLL